ncbi:MULTISPECIES: YjdF family protein [unclassified Clostridium]|uniref:YjdF family protein n=1 Tax=unclassified Clostridium TaxID=2614128 RepID=UPI0013E91A78|nr:MULTISPECIES: YjdF family protein [unclassified Clostridium]MBZ9625564.1 YjdF family protein [Clostridium sp. FP2]MBZ9637009.1 YjdF family protein [Clostridium sp. FP1]
MEISIKLNVFFEGGFWVGVFEKVYGGKYEVSKITFGAEPKDYEVFDFILKNFYNLRFSSPLCIESVEKGRINPKRYQREIKKEMENKGIGTKAQLAMQLQHEINKTEKKIVSREEKEEEKQRKYESRQQNKKSKHRGH